ncbi:putative NA+/H+ ANTIPORTER [Helicobacter bizzozeronii CCUG 35545]|nr:putative NA+/H+ ANTIPORTER [Helicobacter bizzozeronii CCUG 35545]
MHDLFILTIITPLIVLVPYVSRLVKMPVAVLEIAFGALGVYFGLFTPNPSFGVMAEVGFLFLMFLGGMEVDLHMFRQINRALLKKIPVLFWHSLRPLFSHHTECQTLRPLHHRPTHCELRDDHDLGARLWQRIAMAGFGA